MKGNFLSVWFCWVVIILDKLITIFLHASCSSTSTCHGADYSKGKGTNKKKQKGRYNIVEIEIVLKGSEINNVIVIHD